MTQTEDKWVSVSTLAKKLGISKQAIYNRIRSGKYETQTFQRGSMIGVLVKVDGDEESQG